jgi:type I restriction enzyme, S subunit
VNYPAYPKYKSTGVEWLGDVPEHWDVVPLKQVTNFVNGMAFKPDDWSAEGVPIIRIENLNGGSDFNGFDGEVGRRYHITRGDLLFGWSGNRGTSFGPFLWWRDGTHYLNQHIFKLIGFACEKTWFYWTLNGVTRTIEDEAHGIIGMVHVTRGRLGAIKIPMIPRLEQRAIAGFLNAKMEGLDNLVTKKLALIEKLKEKRTALISRTVTRGLPPEAAREVGLKARPKLKPTGIEWLGDIPEHWEVVQLFRVAAKIQTGPFGSQLHQSDYVEGGVPLINPSHLIDDNIAPDDQETVTEETARLLARHALVAGDVVFARRGEIGRCAVVGEEHSGWLCGTGSMLVRLRDCDARYFTRVFRSAGFSALLTLNAVGTTMANLNPSIVGRMRVPFPALAEQCAIADFLDRETTNIDRMVAKVEAAIERLQEYRSALITAAVTGKIDVREADSKL